MTGKRLAVAIIILAVAAGGAVFALRQGGDDQSAQSSEPATASEQASTTGDTSQQAQPAPSKTTGPHGDYITLADYDGSKSNYGNDKKVLFFHAAWCPICQSIENEIKADPGRIPENDVIIKTDFDSQTDLKKKYGVTQQYTFVQIDNGGQQIKKWSATTLDEVINQIE